MTSSENQTLYSESFKIRASEVNQHGKATLPALCALFQEVAGNHALLLNFDISDLHEEGLTWVLHRMDIQMHRYPDWREEITIHTWPAAGDALRAYRDYEIRDAEGETIGVCLSYWMMMNMKSRRPVRMPREILNTRLEDRDHVLAVKSERLSPMEEADHSTLIKVRSADLDMNQHVNNARYLEWMLESLPAARSSEIEAVDIIFVQEITEGEQIQSEVTFNEDDPGLSKHQLKNKQGRMVALAEMNSGL